MNTQITGKQNPQTQTHPARHYRNIIFDLGGVLVNWNPRAVIEQTFKDAKDIPWDLVKSTKSQEWLDLDRGTISPDHCIAALSQQYPGGTFPTFFNAALESLVPIDAGLKILGSVRAQGYKTFILSNLGEASFNKLNTIENFFSTFDGALFSYQEKVIKPEPEIYQLLLQRYNLNPAESIFIDDLEVNIKAAKDHGIDGIVCTDHATVTEELRKRGILP